MALDREAQDQLTGAARSGGCAAFDIASRVSTARSRAHEGCRPPARAASRSGCSGNQQPRTFGSSARRSAARSPTTCTASAIAASLPDTSSRPFGGASSRTRRPFGNSPIPRPPCSSSAACVILDPRRRPRSLDHDQCGHDLRQARDRQHPQRVASPEHLVARRSNTSPARGGLRSAQVERVDPRRGRRSDGGSTGGGFDGHAAHPVRRRVYRDRQPRRPAFPVVGGGEGEVDRGRRQASGASSSAGVAIGLQPAGAGAPAARAASAAASRGARLRRRLLIRRAQTTDANTPMPAARAPASVTTTPKAYDAALDRGRDRKADQ